MSKKKSEAPDQFESVENALSRTERYIEENQKSLSIIVLAIIVIIGGYLGYKKFYLGPLEREAQNQLFAAEQYFERDSFNLAINGDGNNFGFLDIIDEYKVTKSANLAHYYAGISYLRLGKYNEAINYLKGFDSDDEMVAPIALGAMGDAYIELGDTDKAINFYKKAISKSHNNLTTPIYLKKLALIHELNEQWEEALEIYKRIKDEYPESQEGQEAEKYIAKMKILLSK